MPLLNGIHLINWSQHYLLPCNSQLSLSLTLLQCESSKLWAYLRILYCKTVLHYISMQGQHWEKVWSFTCVKTWIEWRMFSNTFWKSFSMTHLTKIREWMRSTDVCYNSLQKINFNSKISRELWIHWEVELCVTLHHHWSSLCCEHWEYKKQNIAISEQLWEGTESHWKA